MNLGDLNGMPRHRCGPAPLPLNPDWEKVLHVTSPARRYRPQVKTPAPYADRLNDRASSGNLCTAVCKIGSTPMAEKTKNHHNHANGNGYHNGNVHQFGNGHHPGLSLIHI